MKKIFRIEAFNLTRKQIFFFVLFVNLFGCSGGNDSNNINSASNSALNNGPYAFSFIDQTGVNPNTLISSNSIRIGGINETANISIAGGEYSINGSAFTSINGSIQNMQNVVVRQTSSAEILSTKNATLTIGSSSDTFTVTTRDNALPQAENKNHDVFSGSYVLRQSVGNDQDNETLLFEKLSNPLNGAITFDNSGLFIFRPNENFIGSDQFDYKVIDAFGRQDAATISFDIQEPASGAILDLRANGLTLNSLAAIWTSTQLTSDYEIRYSGEVITEENWPQAEIFENNIPPSTVDLDKNFYIDQLDDDTVYYFAIRQIDSQGVTGPISNVIYAKTVPTPLALVDSNDIAANNASPIIVEFNQDQQKIFTLTNDGLTDLQYNLEISNIANQSPSWVTSNDSTGSISPGETKNVLINFVANVLPGDYSATLSLEHNSLYQDFVEVPLFLRVSNDITPPPSINTLNGASPNFDAVNLTWQAISDDGVAPLPLAGYDIRYSLSPINDSNWDSATSLNILNTPLIGGNQQTLTVDNLNTETLYYFAIKGIDQAGNTSELSNIISVTTLGPPVANVSIDNISMELREGIPSSTSIQITDSGESTLAYSIFFRNPEQITTTANENQQVLIRTTQARKPRVMNELPLNGNYLPNQLIIRFKPSSELYSSHSDIHLHYDSQLIDRIDVLDMQVWQINDDSKLLETMQLISQRKDVIFVEPNYAVIANEIPDDAFFSQLWGLNNLGQTGGIIDADIDAVETWNTTTGSRDVVVAIIDSGIDYTHPDLAANMWMNEGEISNNGIDDDNNGYVDDIYGYDFANNDGDPFDDSNHGTHVAGTIGAAGNNGIGVVGVSHQVSLMGIKFLGANGFGSTSDAAEGIIYAVDNGAMILNNSWGGGGFSETLRAAIEYAHQNDVLFLAAAGNSGTNNDISPSYPASYEVDNVISVAATNHNDQLAAFSQYGSQSVDLGAPGVDILSSVPGNAYTSFNGTSMATPHVSGVAALLKAHAPNLSNLEIKQILFDSIDPIPSLQSTTVTGGRLNSNEALKLAGPSWISAPPELFAGSVESGQTLELSLTVDPTDLSPGVHVAEIVILTNDPLSPEFTATISLNVLPDIESPSPITDLVVTEITESRARLNFTASGDDGIRGKAKYYDVRFSTSNLDESNWDNATSVSGLIAPSETGTQESFIVSSLLPNSDLWIGIRAIDNVGLISNLSNVVQITTLNAELEIIPDEITPLVLTSGSSEDIILLLRNVGQVDLNITAGTSPNNSSFTLAGTQHFASRNIIKGGVDYRVGPPVTLGSGGIDDFGYVWIDSYDQDGPTFTWTDISSTGTLVNGLTDDNVIGPIEIGFPFPFYELDLNQLYISSNGFITFDSNSDDGCCNGQPIPKADFVNHLIAWMWSDLHPKNGTVHFQNINNESIIIQFTNYGEYGGSGTVDAQVHLKNNGEIIFYYKDFSGNINNENVSIGIESQTGESGLQVAFNTVYLENELALSFKPFWLSSNFNESILPPNMEEQITLNVDTQNLEVGDYDGYFIIQSNDITRPQIILPVSLEVIP